MSFSLLKPSEFLGSDNESFKNIGRNFFLRSPKSFVPIFGVDGLIVHPSDVLMIDFVLSSFTVLFDYRIKSKGPSKFHQKQVLLGTLNYKPTEIRPYVDQECDGRKNFNVSKITGCMATTISDSPNPETFNPKKSYQAIKKTNSLSEEGPLLPGCDLEDFGICENFGQSFNLNIGHTKIKNGTTFPPEVSEAIFTELETQIPAEFSFVILSRGLKGRIDDPKMFVHKSLREIESVISKESLFLGMNVEVDLCLRYTSVGDSLRFHVNGQTMKEIDRGYGLFLSKWIMNDWDDKLDILVPGLPYECLLTKKNHYNDCRHFFQKKKINKQKDRFLYCFYVKKHPELKLSQSNALWFREAVEELNPERVSEFFDSKNISERIEEKFLILDVQNRELLGDTLLKLSGKTFFDTISDPSNEELSSALVFFDFSKAGIIKRIEDFFGLIYSVVTDKETLGIQIPTICDTTQVFSGLGHYWFNNEQKSEMFFYEHFFPENLPDEKDLTNYFSGMQDNKDERWSELFIPIQDINGWIDNVDLMALNSSSIMSRISRMIPKNHHQYYYDKLYEHVNQELLSVGARKEFYYCNFEPSFLMFLRDELVSCFLNEFYETVQKEEDVEWSVEGFLSHTSCYYLVTMFDDLFCTDFSGKDKNRTIVLTFSLFYQEIHPADERLNLKHHKNVKSNLRKRLNFIGRKYGLKNDELLYQSDLFVQTSRGPRKRDNWERKIVKILNNFLKSKKKENFGISKLRDKSTTIVDIKKMMEKAKLLIEENENSETEKLYIKKFEKLEELLRQKEDFKKRKDEIDSKIYEFKYHQKGTFKNRGFCWLCEEEFFEVFFFDGGKWNPEVINHVNLCVLSKNSKKKKKGENRFQCNMCLNVKLIYKKDGMPFKQSEEHMLICNGILSVDEKSVWVCPNDGCESVFEREKDLRAHKKDCSFFFNNPELDDLERQYCKENDICVSFNDEKSGEFEEEEEGVAWVEERSFGRGKGGTWMLPSSLVGVTSTVSTSGEQTTSQVEPSGGSWALPSYFGSSQGEGGNEIIFNDDEIEGNEVNKFWIGNIGSNYGVKGMGGSSSCSTYTFSQFVLPGNFMDRMGQGIVREPLTQVPPENGLKRRKISSSISIGQECLPIDIRESEEEEEEEFDGEVEYFGEGEEEESEGEGGDGEYSDEGGGEYGEYDGEDDSRAISDEEGF